MDTNYYEECIQTIQKCIDEKDYKQAVQLAQKELSLPYVPYDIEEQLLQLYRFANAALKENVRAKTLSIDEIIDGLKDSEEKQLISVNALAKYNLRDSLDLVQEYLGGKHSVLAGALLMESLIEQQIPDEISVYSEDYEISFIPRYTELPYQSDGFIAAQNYLKEWFENDDVSFYQMASQILVQEAYLHLPVVFEEDEALMLALSIVHYVFMCLQNEQEFRQFVNKKGINCPFLVELKSNNL